MGGDRMTGRNRVIRRKIEMDDNRLIELVRRNPLLYKIDSEHQSNNSGNSVSRASIWVAIGAELKRHPLFCKKRWGNIRDNYKKAMKKYHWRLAQGHTSAKKYKFFEQLNFLPNPLISDEKKEENTDEDEHQQQQSNETTLEVKCEPDIDTEFDDTNLFGNFNRSHRYYDDYLDQAVSQFDHHNEEAQAEHNARVNVGADDEKGPENEEAGHEIDEEEDYHRRSPPKIEPYLNGTHLGLRQAKRRKREESPTAAAASAPANQKSMRYIVERVESSDRYVERHPVDAFLAGIAPTLKTLSPYYLSLAKTNIYSIVQEYEMAMIMEERNGLHHRL